MEHPLRGYGSGPGEGPRAQCALGKGSEGRSQRDATLPAVFIRAGMWSLLCFSLPKVRSQGLALVFMIPECIKNIFHI